MHAALLLLLFIYWVFFVVVVVVVFSIIFTLFNFSRLLHLNFCLTSPSVSTCIYTVVLVALSITDAGNQGLPKCLKK